jgi:predicted ATPase/DNA-binding CsgD family transcriptional regulator
MAISDIPIFPTPFVGRHNELVHITSLLVDPTCRLLTLLGPGGIGKTRLALEAAFRQQVQFTDGMCFVALQPLGSPDLVIPAIANALELRFYPGGDPKQQILDFLRDKQILLVLDNFEHLLDEAIIVSDMLMSAPQLKVMTTSRERLNLVEEWIFDVAGLSVPQNFGEEPISNYDAVRLFVQSAQRVQAGFQLAEAQQAVVTRICQLVGGMPLGIEMAAAWVRALSCDEIADEIERGMDILASTARNVPTRHRSMRVALDHSWTLLMPLEQRGCKYLSVFRGGFTRDAGSFVSDVSIWTLTALVDKSLLRVDPQGRYHIQELLRQYAEEQLEESEESVNARDRHAAYYAEFMHERWEALRSQQQREALDDIEADIDNIRLAWHTLCQQPNHTVLRHVAPSLWLAYDLRCRFHEMVALLGEGIAALRPIATTPEVNRTLGLFLALQGWTHVGMGLPAKGQALAQEGLAFLQEAGNSEEIFLALLSLQLTTNYLNQPQETRRVSEKAITMARQSGNTWGVARASYELGNFTLSEAENPTTSEVEHRVLCEEAKSVAEECLRLAEECGDLWLRASVSGFFLGNVYHVLGNYAEAKKRYEQSIPLFETVGQSWAIGAVHRLLGLAACGLQDYDTAYQHYMTSLQVFYHNGQVHEQITTLLGVSELLLARANKVRAVQLLNFIAQHPVTPEIPRTRSIQLLQLLETVVPTDQYYAAVEYSNQIRLDDLMIGLWTNEQSQPVQSPVSLIDPLTTRELEILRLMASGMKNREIADQLTLSVGTVKWYSSQILSKLHVQNRVQALAQARTLNLLS